MSSSFSVIGAAGVKCAVAEAITGSEAFNRYFGYLRYN
jgi:hypothetical protein